MLGGKMKLTINSNRITPLFTYLNEFIEEANIIVSEKGLDVISPDRAVICVCGISIPKSRFSAFELDKKETLGLNISNFLDMLKRAEKDESISFSLEAGRLVVEFDGRTFKTSLLSIEEEIPSIEDLKFASSFSIPSSMLKTAISDSMLVSDTIYFETTSSELKLYSLGDVSKNEMIIEKGNSNLKGLDGIAKAQYPLGYLRKLKINPDDDVKVEFATDMPLKITFTDGYMVLAPRVQEEEPEEVPKEEEHDNEES
jgi:hypothetical protein